MRRGDAASWRELGRPVARPARHVEQSAPRTRRPAQEPAPPADGRRRRAGTSWRFLLASLKEQLTELSGPVVTTTSRPARSVATLELAINVPESLGTSGLVLDVFERAAGVAGKPGKLKRAGVDLTTPAPFTTAIAAVNRAMDEIEKLLEAKEAVASGVGG